jgi:hypothetical protein
VQRNIRVETVESAVRALFHRVHRAGDEATSLVDLAVVDAVRRLVRFWIDDELAVAGLEVEKMKPVGERHDRAALAAQRHRADLRGTSQPRTSRPWEVQRNTLQPKLSMK